MVVFSNCKINLGLHILGKRADGFHNLETCFYPVNFCDVLEAVPANDFSFNSIGIPVYATPDNNLIVKAYKLLLQDYPKIEKVAIHLLKNIPTGAGIGGGSANAAFTIQLLNQMFNLQINEASQLAYAASLGSDCSFFIRNKPSIATGRGELLQPFELNLLGKYILLVLPKVHVSTKDAFANIEPKNPTFPIVEILQMPINEWKTLLKNDFETPIFQKFPDLSTIKNELYANNALYASMSGSGSTVYGIFENENAANNAANFFIGRYAYKTIPL